MHSDSNTFFQHLNDLEIRYAAENLHNFSLCIDNSSRHDLRFPKALEIVCRSTISHDYKRVLNLSLSDLGLEKVETVEQKLLCTFVGEIENDSLVLYARQIVLMFVGVSALQMFIRANATGPPLAKDLEDFALCTQVLGDENCEAMLAVNGEWLPDCVQHTQLLWFSYLFLQAAAELEGGCSQTCGWWLLRHLGVHQRLLPERMALLHKRAMLLLEQVTSMQWMKDKEERNQLARLLFCVEAMQLHLHYHEVTAARNFLTTAQDIVGLDIALDGAVGRRTRFQHKAVAQLVVKLKKGGFRGSLPADNCNVPKDLLLEDDTLLNKVAFVEDMDSMEVRLQPEEQIVLLAHCLLLRRSEATDLLLMEQVASYVGCVLDQPRSWCVYVTALVLRCRLEKESSRRVERALMQLEAVVESLRAEDPPFDQRSSLFYASAFPMAWTLEKELADIQLSLGLIKNALSLYEKLQLWEEMVYCLRRLGRTAAAEELVRKQLQLKETPALWCLLGDVMDDRKAYLKADSLSGGTSARAQRSLGDYHYKRREYGKCILYFSRSLEINHLQPDVWFSLGFSALQEEDYPLAAKAYRQQVVLQPDHSGAWNNLSKAYILTGQKERAWRSLQEALRLNYEEWRTWETFLLTCLDIGAFDDALRAWHRLLDLRGKYTDALALGILVKAINEDIEDRNGQPASHLRKPALELLGRLSAAVTNDCSVWEAYAALQCPEPEKEVEVDRLEKAVLLQQKAVRHCSDGKRSVEVVDRLVRLSSSLVRLLGEGDARRSKYKSTTRLTSQAVVIKAKQTLVDVSDEEKEHLAESIKQLEALLAALQVL